MISVDMKVLKAMLNLAGENDVRSYINGVLVAVVDDHTRYVASNDSIVGVFKHAPLGSGETGEVIVPRSIIEQCKVKGKASAIVLVDPFNRKLTFNGVTYSWDDVGKYPDYRRVVPAGVSGEKSTFDPELLMEFKKAFVELNKAGYDIGPWAPCIGSNGSEGALVRVGTDATKKYDSVYSPDFVGVIMPLIGWGDEVITCPSWVSKK
jgi:DNA polymerase-3 subunit beta